MNSTEKIANAFLESLNIGPVIYEPDGNVPPDFLVDSRIAVEVRRLNQNYVDSSGTHQGIEQLAIPFKRNMKRFLPTISKNINGQSWFVTFDIKRPFPPRREVETLVGNALRKFVAKPSRENVVVNLTNNLRMDIFPSSYTFESAFVLGGIGDEDSGGFVLGEILENLRLCSLEKEIKIAKFRANYPEWWLVLPDYIGYGFDDIDIQDYRRALRFEHCWDKIILLDPNNFHRFFELSNPPN